MHADPVQLIDPVAFESEVSESRRNFLSSAAERLEASAQHPRTNGRRRKKLHSRLDANRRLSKLWLKQQKRLVLHAIKVTDDQGEADTISDGVAMSKGLAAAWKPIFTEKEIPIRSAEQYLSVYGDAWDWSLASRPDADSVRLVLQALPNTASGPDGLPYAAWKHGGEDAISTLWQITDAQCRGELPPTGFNDSATIFVPKGDFATDAVAMVRNPMDTRPLSLKNADNKVCAACVSKCIADVVTAGTHESQNGFVRGRQLIQNPVDLDSAARAFALKADDLNQSHVEKKSEPSEQVIAILAFFDFATAFPSVAHAWLFAVLRAAHAPTWLINYVSSLYAENKTYHMNSHGKTLFFSILAGVLQGRPLSATLSIFAINPFLIHFHSLLSPKGLGIVRACADDIGICLQNLQNYKTLTLAHEVFQEAKKLANLNLKPTKCNVIPLNVCPLRPGPHQLLTNEIGAAECSAIQKWLLTNLPDWQDFKLCMSAKYLGFHLGPKAGADQWVAPLRKWQERAKDIAASHMGSKLAALTYNSRAVSVLGFIAQLAPPPDEIFPLEQATLHYIMHIPTNSFERRVFSNLEQLGCKAFLSISFAWLAWYGLHTAPLLAGMSSGFRSRRWPLKHCRSNMRTKDI